MARVRGHSDITHPGPDDGDTPGPWARLLGIFPAFTDLVFTWQVSFITQQV